MLAIQTRIGSALPCAGQTRLRHKGFSLVELAIVVAVIALLIGSLLVPLATQVQQRNIAQTDRQLDEIRDALIGYAMVNSRLPRPAISITDGTERPPCSGGTAVRDCTGYLPWVTLGVRKTDAWGKMFRYSVSPEFASGAFNFATSTVNNKTIQTRDALGNPITLASNLPAVVLSYGENNFGMSDSGTNVINTSTTNLDEQSNDTKLNTCVPDCTSFFGRPMSTSGLTTGGEFDDMVVWLSNNLLFSRMVAAGKLP